MEGKVGNRSTKSVPRLSIYRLKDSLSSEAESGSGGYTDVLEPFIVIHSSFEPRAFHHLLRTEVAGLFWRFICILVFLLTLLLIDSSKSIVWHERLSIDGISLFISPRQRESELDICKFRYFKLRSLTLTFFSQHVPHSTRRWSQNNHVL